MSKGLWIVIGLFLAAAVAGFFFLRKPALAPTTTQASPTPGAGTTTTQTEGEVREITVEGDEYAFSPESITVLAGEKIRLTFKNMGNLPHNFAIDELGVSTKTIAGGNSDTIEFTAETTGTFAFYCSIAGHRQLGMEGELEVQ